MWVKQYHKPPIWECFIPHKNGDLGDGLLVVVLPLPFGNLPFYGASWCLMDGNGMSQGCVHVGK